MATPKHLRAQRIPFHLLSTLAIHESDQRIPFFLVAMAHNPPDRLAWHEMLFTMNPHLSKDAEMKRSNNITLKMERCTSIGLIPQIDDFRKLVKFLVGKNEVPFVLHQDVLEKASAHLKSACDKRWAGDIAEGEICIIKYENINIVL